MVDFDKAFDRLMGHEGGYTPGKGDPGGETKWGICKRSYPQLDVQSLTRDGAKAIYKRDFWDRVAIASPALRYQAFDFAVNSGIDTTVRKLQQVLGVADDGAWGPVSAAALARVDESDVLMRLLAARIRFMTRCSTWALHGAGWMNRIAGQLDYGAEDTQ